VCLGVVWWIAYQIDAVKVRYAWRGRDSISLMLVMYSVDSNEKAVQSVLYRLNGFLVCEVGDEAVGL